MFQADLIKDLEDDELGSVRDLSAGEDNGLFSLFIAWGKKCTAYKRKDRPDIKLVLEECQSVKQKFAEIEKAMKYKQQGKSN